MENIIFAGIILAIIGLSAAYVVKAKRRGQKCIGCPSGCCSKKADGQACCCSFGDDNA